MEGMNKTDLHNPEQEPQDQESDKQNQEEEPEAEEALSLCDLPLHTENSSSSSSSYKNIQRSSSSEPPDHLFEFFSSDFRSEFCSAEDIIFGGKLIPLNEHPQPTDQTIPKIRSEKEDQRKKIPAVRKRSESLSALQTSVTRSNSAETKLMRNSRSLDYRKLYRRSNSTVLPEYREVKRNSSGKSVEKSDKKVSKPRWYLMMTFGMVKFPTEMDLSDIKNRQSRLSRKSLFPTTEDGANLGLNRSSGKGSNWKLLIKALSCKDESSVAVTSTVCQTTM